MFSYIDAMLETSARAKTNNPFFRLIAKWRGRKYKWEKQKITHEFRSFHQHMYTPNNHNFWDILDQLDLFLPLLLEPWRRGGEGCNTLNIKLSICKVFLMLCFSISWRHPSRCPSYSCRNSLPRKTKANLFINLPSFTIFFCCAGVVKGLRWFSCVFRKLF